MFRSTAMVTMVAGLVWSVSSGAQAPASAPPSSAPAGSTGLCRDGSYWSGATKQGACRGHKGVQDWYGASGASGASSAANSDASAGGANRGASSAMAPVATPPAAVAPAATSAPAATPPPAAVTNKMPAPTKAQAPGGGPGQVWVNSSSKVYHCPTDQWYGKTKNGQYMSESDAIAAGNHADHGKACSK